MCRATERKGQGQVSEGPCFWEDAVREDAGQLKIKQKERVQEIQSGEPQAWAGDLKTGMLGAAQWRKDKGQENEQPSQAQGQLLALSTGTIGFSGPTWAGAQRQASGSQTAPPRQAGTPKWLPEGPDRTSPHLPCGVGVPQHPALPQGSLSLSAPRRP